MKRYSLSINLHIRQHILPAHIFVEEELRHTSHRADEIIVFRFLVEQSRRYWDESNIDQLQQLFLDDFQVYVRLEDPFWYLFRTGDSGHARQFMEYDINNIQFFRNYFSSPMEQLYLRRFVKTSNAQKHYMDLLTCHELQNFPCSTYRRILKVLCGIEAIRKTELDGDPPQKVLCLKILFKYTRQPYITSSEVKSLIKCLGRENVSDELLQKICQLFEAYFPESAQPYRPRSLKHLSRCQVRDNLKLASKYPEGVRMLYIPRQLHSYILIDYLPWIPTELSSYIEFDLPAIIDASHHKVTFRISDRD